MKSQTHPEWHLAKVTCSCGNIFTVGSTVPEIRVEVCSVCHPYFTGNMKFVDTAGRVDAFRARLAGAAKKNVSKTDRRAMKRAQRIKEESDRPETLAELRKVVKAAKNK